MQILGKHRHIVVPRLRSSSSLSATGAVVFSFHQVCVSCFSSAIMVLWVASSTATNVSVLASKLYKNSRIKSIIRTYAGDRII